MQILESSEDYLEAILMLQERNGHVRSIDIADELNYSKASISVAMKKLRENGYIGRVANALCHFLVDIFHQRHVVKHFHVFVDNVLVKSHGGPCLCHYWGEMVRLLHRFVNEWQ